MKTCQLFRPVLLGHAQFGLAAALLMFAAVRTTGSEPGEQQQSALLHARVDAAWRSSMTCCNGKCYRRRGPYYVEEYTNIRTAYDNPSKPKEFTVVANVRVKDVRDDWSPALPDQEIMKYRIIERSEQEWEFAALPDALGDETSRIACDQLAFLKIASCSCVASPDGLQGVGTRNRAAQKRSR